MGSGGFGGSNIDVITFTDGSITGTIEENASILNASETPVIVIVKQ
jgi:hypothetical protein